MLTPERKPRLVVISPFLDKRHGTERCVAEQVERLSDTYEIHLYSERVEDVDLRKMIWHHVALPPGPLLLRYLWWLLANPIQRWRDRRFRGLVPDVVYSPGVNCMDADVISVHIVFGEFREQVREQLKFRENSWRAWPVLLHRRMYYRLCIFLERRVYRSKQVALAVISKKTARDVARWCGRGNDMKVVYYGLDPEKFNLRRREAMRASSRAELGLPDDAFVVLLVGNDWKKKGLSYLLEAASRTLDRNLRILVVGQDIEAPYREMIRRLDMAEQVIFLPLRSDVEFYYAATDAYAGPSLEDAFALPPAEAMACGLPAITTRMAGVSEIITQGVDGLILEDPTDVHSLSKWLVQLATDVEWRHRMGEAAARTAAQYTWQRNALEMQDVIEGARGRRKGPQ